MRLPSQRLLIASSAIGFLIILAANSILPMAIYEGTSHLASILIFVALALLVLTVIAMGGLLFAAQPSDRLVTHGIYRFARHPYYLALIIGFLGLALSSNNWIALASALFIVLPVQILRSLREEEDLAKAFPEEWPAYKSKTSFIIPFIW